MRIEQSRIEGVALLRWHVTEDARGGFARTFCRAELAAAGLPFEIVQASVSRNPALHTLRGMHFQTAPHGEAKIVSCLRGRIWDVAVDLRPGSPTSRQWISFELGPESLCSLYLAEGIAHGYLTLEPDSEVQYLMAAEYVPSASSGIRWDDPAIAIDWPAEPAILSDRDRSFPLLGAGNGS